MQIDVKGKLPAGVSAKDLALGIIGKIGTDGGTGHVLEFTGEAIRALSMEGRMTLCNMSIEAGARAGMVAPDETTFAYLKGRHHAPHGEAWDKAVAHWKTLHTDPGAHYDRIVEIDASGFAPYVTWGTNPGMVVPITGEVPDPTFAGPMPIAAPPSAHSNTWPCRRVRRSRPSRSIASSSDRVPTRALKICVQPPK